MKINLLNIALIVVGIIHVLPVIGVLGSERIRMLYDLQLADPNVLLLLRHRAVLFGIVGIIMFAAVLRPNLQRLAIGLGSLSMLSFIGLVLMGSGLNSALIKVAWVDVFALVLLWIAVAWQWFLKASLS